MKEGTVEKDELIIIGIDLGTTHSLVAFSKKDQTEVVKNTAGNSNLLPSIIHFNKENSVLVGDKAKTQLTIAPERTIYSVKRLMGKSFTDVGSFKDFFSYKIIDEDKDALVKIQVEDKFYSPVELSSFILKELKTVVENRLGKSVEKAVITVPAYFNDTQRQATRDAGKLAGLDVLRIINEPTAASLAYGIGLSEDEHKVIAVYDLGGGTFDISILRIENGIFEVLSTHGDTFLGGDDFDSSIVRYWLEEHKDLKSSIENQKGKIQSLRLLAEKAKIKLSSSDNFEENFEGFTLSLDITQFNALVGPIVERSIDSCKSALNDAGIQKQDIDSVILVGGSTRVKLVKNKVKEFFGTEVNDQLNPDEIVAQGAAIQANILAGKQKGILLLDVTPLSLGIETLGGLMDVIVPRNTKIPARAGRQYTTSKDGQSKLKISVYQGERDLVEHNRKLGEFILNGIPPMPAGLPKIEIQFIIDADGILRVKAKELRSDVSQEIEIKSQYGLSEEEMGKMLLESIQHAKDDMAEKAILEATNEANSILLASKKFMQQNQKFLTTVELDSISNFAKKLESTIDSRDKDLINTAIENINSYTGPLAQKAMERVISESMKGKKL
jgi:molecular chaperone HscA